MTMHTRTDTFFERCVTAFLSRLDFLGSPGNLTVLSCFKAERVCVGGKSSKCNTIGLQKPRPEISSQDIF